MLHGSPWVYTYCYCHQMITQQRLKGPWGLLEVTQKSRFCSHPMPACKQLSPQRWSPTTGPMLET